MNHSVTTRDDSAAFNAKASLMSMIDDTNDAIPEGPSVHVYQSKAPPVGWRPLPAPGITLSAPAVAVSGTEYDAIAKALIAELQGDPDEAKKVSIRQRKGAVIEHQGRRVFTRGRS